MAKNIHPYLLSYSIDEQWQEDITQDFGSSPDLKWVVHYEVTLGDLNALESIRKTPWYKKPFSGAQGFNKDGSLGELFGFTVCSPSFRSKPTDDYSSEEISQALIQDIFNEAAAISYLTIQLKNIGEQEVAKISTHFKKFLDTEEWDYSGNTGFEQSKLKYHDYIQAAKNLKLKLEQLGYSIRVSEDIELGALYEVCLKDKK